MEKQKIRVRVKSVDELDREFGVRKFNGCFIINGYNRFSVFKNMLQYFGSGKIYDAEYYDYVGDYFTKWILLDNFCVVHEDWCEIVKDEFWEDVDKLFKEKIV